MAIDVALLEPHENAGTANPLQPGIDEHALTYFPHTPADQDAILSFSDSTITTLLANTPYFNMPMESLLDAIVAGEEPDAVWAIPALLARHEEATPFVKHMLESGAVWQRYGLARAFAGIAPEAYAPILVATAVDADAHPQARVGALYGLSGYALNDQETSGILDAIQESDSPVVRRVALNALLDGDISGKTARIRAYLAHDDPFTRINAARLLLEQGYALTPDAFITLTGHEDYLVRQEACDLLGYFDDGHTATILQHIAATESNQSVLRAATLALRRRHIRTLSEDEQQAMAWLHADDDLEVWQGMHYAMRQNKNAAAMALSTLAQEQSPRGDLSLARLVTLVLGGVFENLSVLRPQPLSTPANKHFIAIHQDMTHYNIVLHNAQSALPGIGQTAQAILLEFVIREDVGIMPVNHAHNPVTGRGFVRRRGFGGSARNYVTGLMDGVDALHNHPHFSEQDVASAWQLIGRVFHVLQDMASPLHAFSVWHVLNSCHFEVYWNTHTSEALQIVAAYDPQPISPPTLAPTSTDRLDAFTSAALETQLDSLPDALINYMDALVWSAYYRASFWGEIRYEETAAPLSVPPTRFDNGTTAETPNTFRTMFDGNLRYHTAWWGDYFEVVDRMDNTFAWNKLFALDAWRPCRNPRGQQITAGHIRSTDAETNTETLRITGRFFFTHKGNRTPYCHPFAHPDGTLMEAHLPHYYGETLFPVMVAYGGGWLAALAEQYPKLFDDGWKSTANEKSLLLHYLEQMWDNAFLRVWPSKEGAQKAPHSGEADYSALLDLYAPRCGCIARP